VVITDDDYDETWRRIRTDDGRVHLAVPEMLAELAALADEPAPGADPAWPFVLSAGERRSFTANTIFRDPAWRKRDVDGALRIHPDSAARLGLVDGGSAKLTTRRASVVVSIECNDSMQPHHISLPNGMGLSYPSAGGEVDTGVAPNELTSSEDRDAIAGTPWHKHVPARLEALPA
jgi:anaerobic selenocysteine-containing dehydrogenase